MRAMLSKAVAALGSLAVAGLCTAATTTIPIDQVGNVGQRSAIAIGPDGFPVVSYIQGEPSSAGANLRVTKCGSIDCITGNGSVNVATGDVQANLGLIVPPDGRPIFAYIQDGQFRVTRCGNAACSIGNTTETLPGSPAFGWTTLPLGNGIALGSDGLPIVTYAQADAVRIVKCNNLACSSFATVVAPHVGSKFAKLSIGADGKPVIVAPQAAGISIAKCADNACTVAPTFAPLDDDTGGGFGRDGFGLALGQEEGPLVARTRATTLRVIECTTPQCETTKNVNALYPLSGAEGSPSATHTGEGLPLIAFSFSGLRVAKCGTSSCASDTTISIIDDRPALLDPSIAIGSDGHPVIAYFDATNQDIFVARCGNATCQDASAERALGQSGEPLAFVTAFENKKVVLVDTVSREPVSEIEVGTGPIGVAFSRDGKKAYVTNYASGTVSYIDVKSRTVEKTVSLGGASQPRGIAVSPDHARLYVAKSGTNEVAVIDRVAGIVLTSVPVGAQPFGLALSPDGATVVTANTTGHSASFVSTATNTLIRTVPVGQQPYGVAITPDGVFAMVANFASNSVSVITLSNGVASTPFAVGLGPFGVAIKGDGTRLYVSNNQNRVTVVDLLTEEVVASIPVGSHPQGIALTPDDLQLYVANQFSDSVTVIDTETNTALGDTIEVIGDPVSLGAFVSPPLIDAIQAVEYFHQNFGHYFVTSIPAEIQALDTAAFVGWARTGETFDVFVLGSGHADVCRFFTVAFPPKSSHFYTPLVNECDIVKTNPDWIYEGIVFEVRLPTGTTCPVGTTPLYRLYNNGQGGAPNHRYTTKTSIRDQMVAAGFIFEGATGCVPK